MNWGIPEVWTLYISEELFLTDNTKDENFQKLLQTIIVPTIESLRQDRELNEAICTHLPRGTDT